MTNSNDTENLRRILGTDLTNRLEITASMAGVSVMDLVKDYCEIGVQKRLCGKRTRGHAMVAFQSGYNEIIDSLKPEENDIREKMIKLMEVSGLLWQS